MFLFCSAGIKQERSAERLLMYRQGEFDFGIPAPPWQPKRPDRVFFALFLQQQDHSRFADMQRQTCDERGIDGSLLLPERFHVSLQHVGDYRKLPSRVVFAASRSGQRINMPAFELTFRQVRSFPGRPATRGRPPRRPLVLVADDGSVCDLGRMLGVEMQRNGLKASGDFVPHLTLAYDEKFVPRQPVDPIRFVAREFVLVHSLRGLTKYVFLDRWWLTG